MIGNVLIKTTPATSIDCTYIEKATGIVIDSVETEGSVTKYLISVDGGKWRRYGEGSWTFVNEQDLTADSILEEGNTKEELTALTETALTAFAGKLIDVAVAIKIEDETELPSLSEFKIVGRNAQIKKDIVFSDVIKLSDETVGITGIDVSKVESSGGAITLYASTLNYNDEWSNYVGYEKDINKAKAIRFKAEVEADRPGMSTAILNSVKVHHWNDAKTATIEGKSVLITRPIVLENEVNRAHAIIRHPKIADTSFDMSIIFGDSKEFHAMERISSHERNGEIEEDFEYIASDNSSSKTATLKIEINQDSGTVTDETLGTGNGRQQTFKLPHHARPETLQIEGSNNWTFKEKTDTLLVTANSGTEIKLSYDWIAQSNYLTAFACVFNS